MYNISQLIGSNPAWDNGYMVKIVSAIIDPLWMLLWTVVITLGVLTPSSWQDYKWDMNWKYNKKECDSKVDLCSNKRWKNFAEGHSFGPTETINYDIWI